MKYTTATAKYTWTNIMLGFSEANRKSLKIKEKTSEKKVNLFEMPFKWWPISARKIGCVSPPESGVKWKT